MRYIQENIIKELDKGYIDKITGKPYRCIKQAPASIITPNADYFVPADNINNSIPDSIGYNQKWQDVTSQRKLSQSYTNNTDKPIVCAVSLSGDGSVTGYIDEITVARVVKSNNDSTITMIVPPKSRYIITKYSGNTTINKWSELR